MKQIGIRSTKRHAALSSAIPVLKNRRKSPIHRENPLPSMSSSPKMIELLSDIHSERCVEPRAVSPASLYWELEVLNGDVPYANPRTRFND
ncbi:hypothetical protein E5843_06670 [Luteimonas yindakuii]|uniref:hypothetical protein n=1 Tax=Luteimonas yindakuii TaxID=2565782 RepID=UPI0010A4EED0|nr:hypothetical protein [Luteimonas yindakuii]QCO67532.1 hypothetical protein E5843_06670 [Luteimonas yindakuii]